MTEEFDTHVPVMLREVIAALRVDGGKRFVDATFGRGGHTRAILDRLPSDGILIALDRDLEAIEYGLAAISDARCRLCHAKFSDVAKVVADCGVTGEVDGILFDLGVSSPQLDNGYRGFSFQRSGPLDMRMDRTQRLTAADWLATIPERELARVLAAYGGERYCRRIARAIVEARGKHPIVGTEQLAEIVKSAHPCWELGKHPATRTFQAIRIAVNGELEELEAGLEAAWPILKVGGRLVVVSFHSLEEGVVKRVLRRYSGGELPAKVPVRSADLGVRLRCVGKAMRATEHEVAANVRARSAVMRVIERVG